MTDTRTTSVFISGLLMQLSDFKSRRKENTFPSSLFCCFGFFFNFIPAFISSLPSLISHFIMLNFTLSYLGYGHMNNIMLPVRYTALTTGHVSYSVPESLQTQCINSTFQMLPTQPQETDSAWYTESRFWNIARQ